MDQPTEPVIVFFQEAWSHYFDKDKKGIISTKDFASMINTMMVAVGRPNDAVIHHVINEVEADSSGTMDFQKFLTLMVKVEPSTIMREPVPKNPCELTPTNARSSTYSAAFVPMDALDDVDGEANGDDDDGDNNGDVDM